ncbi:polysaccharide pyruvyl transferase family protein, partial [Paraburkholderia sp. BR14264]|uniref:polysaccharide pyruvyl transferase family protein n=1 Tax=Paraburkholderia sp. BR14264 TaxID=3237001 RepID=UPI003978ABAA
LKVDKGKYMPRPKSTHEFIEMISNCDAIIGARLHACITAYSLDIPSIGLVWNEKLELFGELIGKKENFINVNQFDAKHIVETLQKNRNDYYDIKQRNVLKGLTEEYIERFITML